jgi:hypothetical protein
VAVTLTPAHLLVALTEARQQVVYRRCQCLRDGWCGSVGTLRSAVLAQAALEAVRDYPDAVQLVLNKAMEIFSPYEQEAREARAAVGTPGRPENPAGPGGG